MQRRHTRALVSVLSGFALLFFLVQPSAASTGTINSGHLGVNLTPALTSDLTPGTGTCPNWPPPGTHPTLQLNATSAAPNLVHVTLHVTYAAFTYNNTHYFLSGITGHGTGTINAATGFTVGPFTSSVGNIYAASAGNPCIPDTNAPLCGGVRLNTTTAPLNVTGNFPGGHTFAPPAITGTAVINGSGGIQAAGCLPPFAALNGKTLTLTNVNVTLV